MTTYIRVSDDEGTDCIEIPVEDDGTMYLSTLVAQFPGACGLKYRNPDTKSIRGIKLIEERLICPDEGWVYDFFCTFPKVDSKRKSSDILESSTSKSKRMDLFSRCTDLIVLDLPWKTTEAELKDHFSNFGTVVMAQLKSCPKTGQSRGFGFIRFDDIDVQKRVLAMRHMIGERMCDVKIPKSKEPSNPYIGGKVFVGRITEDFTEQDIRDYFSKFGEVSYVFIPKKPFRAFSFVTFVDPEVAMEVCEQDHIIKGVSVCVCTANARKDSNKNQQQNNREYVDYSGQSGGGYNSSGGGGGGYGGGANGYNSGGAAGGGYNAGANGYNNNSGGGGGGGGGGFNSGSGYNSGSADGGGYNNRNGGPFNRKFGGGGGQRESWNNYNGSTHGGEWGQQGGGGGGNWGSNEGGLLSYGGPKGMDYDAIAAPIVAAISQQLGGMAPPNMNQPPPPPPHGPPSHSAGPPSQSGTPSHHQQHHY